MLISQCPKAYHFDYTGGVLRFVESFFGSSGILAEILRGIASNFTGE
jgi:hypothetical protein